ncbi:MAG: HDOD domain-containing protein [Zoogloeaceae bacterium]|nr:HDOD domain-containing protein [Rhodocyclaceae bacterium]MCP5237371.1 HDOD domain-containing protein [Zoogloeaceae bacterium]
MSAATMTETAQVRATDLVERCSAELALPRDYAALRLILEDANGTVLQLSRALELRPPLASRLLKLLSGPLHSPNGEHWSIERAVNQFGMQRIVDLSLLSLLPQALERLDTSLLRSDFWPLSVRCGLAARAIAAICRRPERDRLLCAGCLMPLGLALLWHANPRAASGVAGTLADHGNDLVALQRAAMGTDHIAVSAALLRQWQLPAPIQRALAGREAPTSVVPYHLEAAILQVAASVAGFPGAPPAPPVAALDLIGLGEVALAGIASEFARLRPVYQLLLSGRAALPSHATRHPTDLRSEP